MEGVKVQVLEANVYLLPNNRAGAFAEEGQIIEVRAGAYADRLVAEGALAYWNDEMGATTYVAPSAPAEDEHPEVMATVAPPPEAELAVASRRKRRGE